MTGPTTIALTVIGIVGIACAAWIRTRNNRKKRKARYFIVNHPIDIHTSSTFKHIDRHTPPIFIRREK